MTTILTTTGTSLLTNTAQALRKPFKEVTDEELHDYIISNLPEKVSAETNSLLKIAQKTDEIILLYTDTPDGRRCANIIYDYLQNRDWLIYSREIPIKHDEAYFERQGLRSLVDILIDEISKAQRREQEVIINATGGFKAEIAYTTMVGMIFQVPVKYIYQGFNQPITFPALPVTWDTNLLLAYENFFEWIDVEPRHQVAVEKRLKPISDVERIRAFLLQPDNDGFIYLSPAGDILWQRVRQQRQEADEATDPPASEIPAVKKISSSLKEVKHHYPKYTLKLVEKLAALAAVEEITGSFFENTATPRLKGVSEDGCVYMLWADGEKGTNLTVRTTARGIAQTLRVCDRIIRPAFEDFCKKK